MSATGPGGMGNEGVRPGDPDGSATAATLASAGTSPADRNEPGPDGSPAPRPVDGDDTIVAEGTSSGPPGQPVPRASGGPRPVVEGYEILGELGRGGMGVVYHARMVRLNRPCALKMILAGAHADAVTSIRFLGEAEAVARLHHPNIVQIYHVGEAQGLPFFELEFVDGGGLDRRLDGTPWAAAAAASLVERLALGVAEAHRQGIVHRDIKPSNVLMAADGTPKLADFGLAKWVGQDGGLTRTDSVLGSPSYMSPEQAEGHARDVGPRADVYALGAICFELLTGRPPFKGSTVIETLHQVKNVEPVPPSRLVPGLPRDLEKITLKCLEKSPERRYAAAAELAEDLRRFLDGDSVLARPTSIAEQAAKWSRRRPAIAAMAAAVLLMTAALLGLAAFSYVRISKALADTEESRRIALDEGARAAEARLRAERGRGEALAARNTAVDEAYRALMSETRALRLAREPGWRGEALANLGRLAASASARKDPYKIRTEAVACLAELDSSPLTTLEAGHLGTWSVAFSPDGRSLATSDEKNSRLIHWDIDRRVAIAQIPKASGCAPFAYRPDGTCLAFGAAGDRVEFHPLRAGVATPAALVGRQAAVALAFDATGRRLAVAWGSTAAPPVAVPVAVSRIQVYDLETGSPPWSIAGPFDDHLNYKAPLALSPDGSLVATAGPGHSVQWYRVGGDGTPITPGRHRSHVEALRFSPDGAYLASGARAPDSSVVLWDVAGAREHLALHEPASTVFDVAFSPDGSLVASNGGGGLLHIWDSRTGRPKLAIPNDSSQLALAFSPDGDRIALAGSAAILVRLDGRRERRQFLGHSNGVNLVTFHPTRPVMTSCGLEIFAWDLDNGAARHLEGSRPGCSGLAYDPSGRWLLSSHSNPDPLDRSDRVRLRDAISGEPIRGLPGCSAQMTYVAFDRSGRRAIGGDAAGRLVVWDVADWQVVQTRTLAGPVRTATLVAGGAKFLALDGRGPVLGPLGDGALTRPAGASGAVRCLAATPAEDVCVLAESDGTLRALALPDFAPLSTMAKSHFGAVNALAISPDGRLLATAGGDRRVVLHDPRTLRPFFELAMPTELVRGLAFHPDGSKLAACGNSEPVIIWDLALIRRGLGSLGLTGDLPEPGPLAPPSPPPGPPPDPLVAEALQRLDSLPRGLEVWSERIRYCNSLTPDRPLFDRLLARRPDDPILRFASGLDRARRRDWSRAAVDFARGGDFGASTEFTFDHACLQVLEGDLAGYHRLLAGMARQDDATTDPYRGFVLARTAMLAARPPGPSTPDAVRWGRLGVARARSPWTLHALGMALLRDGRPAEAIERLDESDRSGDWGRAHLLNWLGRALACGQLGRQAESRRWLARASEQLDRTPPVIYAEPNTLPMTDWLEAQVLRLEAEPLALDSGFPADVFAR